MDVRSAIERYFEGHRTRDPEVMRAAFHPEARLEFVEEGRYGSWSLEEYLRHPVFIGAPWPDELQRHRRVVMVNAGKETAVATLEIDYPEVFITDRTTLLRLNESWTIVNKVFEIRRKKAEETEAET